MSAYNVLPFSLVLLVAVAIGIPLFKRVAAMLRSRISLLSGALVALGLTMGLVGQSASANVYTWDPGHGSGLTDGSGTWSTATTNFWNGSSDVAWTATGLDTAIFGNGHAGSYTVTVPATVNVGAITFNAGSTYTISGAGNLLLGGASSQYLLGSGANGTGAAGITDNATGITTISVNAITYIGPRTWSAPTGGTLAISAPVENEYYNGPGFGNIAIAGSGVVSVTSPTQENYGTYNVKRHAELGRRLHE